MRQTVPGEEERSLSFSELKRQARTHILAPRRPNLFLVTALYYILTFLLWILVVNLSDFGQFLQEMTASADAFVRSGGVLPLELPPFYLTLLGSVFFVIPWLFIWTLDLGYLFYARGIVQGETMSFWSLMEGFNYLIDTILIRAIRSAPIVAGLSFSLILDQSLVGLFFLTLGLVAVCAFSQSCLLLLDHPGKGVLWCLTASARLMHGRKLQYCFLMASFLGWYFLTQLPFIFVAASFWFVTYTNFTYVGYYNKITGRGPEEEPQWRRPGMF